MHSKTKNLSIDNDVVYDTRSAAEILGVNPRTVKKLIKDGKIKAAKVGREHRIIGENLKVFLGSPTIAVPSEHTRYKDETEEIMEKTLDELNKPENLNKRGFIKV